MIEFICSDGRFFSCDKNLLFLCSTISDIFDTFRKDKHIKIPLTSMDISVNDMTLFLSVFKKFITSPFLAYARATERIKTLFEYFGFRMKFTNSRREVLEELIENHKNDIFGFLLDMHSTVSWLNKLDNNRMTKLFKICCKFDNVYAIECLEKRGYEKEVDECICKCTKYDSVECLVKLMEEPHQYDYQDVLDECMQHDSVKCFEIILGKYDTKGGIPTECVLYDAGKCLEKVVTLYNVTDDFQLIFPVERNSINCIKFIHELYKTQISRLIELGSIAICCNLDVFKMLLGCDMISENKIKKLYKLIIRFDRADMLKYSRENNNLSDNTQLNKWISKYKSIACSEYLKTGKIPIKRYVPKEYPYNKVVEYNNEIYAIRDKEIEEKQIIIEETQKMNEEIEKMNEEIKKMIEESRKMMEKSQKMTEENRRMIEEQHRKIEEQHRKMNEEHAKIDEEHRKIEERHIKIDEKLD